MTEPDDDPRPAVTQFLNELGKAMRRKALQACWCSSCAETLRRQRYEANEITLLGLISARMHLCPDCGNKRCPHSTHHDIACTASSEPGQPGSRYGTPARQEEATDVALTPEEWQAFMNTVNEEGTP